MPYYPSGGAAGLPLGLAGATAATRYVGATASGAPASGTFSLGDFTIDQTGKVYVCTVAGTPGTWAVVGAGASGGTPALTLGTANTAGVATTFIRDDDTILAFDATAPSTQAFGDAAVVGTATVAAHRDHKHAMMSGSAPTFPLTAAGNETFQPGGVANSVLTLANAASAVNLVTLTGTATTVDPTLVVSGDANRGLVINPAGTGTITVGGKSDTGIPLTVAGNSATQTGNLLSVLQNPGGNTAFAFTTANTMTNGITFAAKATGVDPTITSSGTDTNIALAMQSKGTGDVYLMPGSASGTVSLGDTQQGSRGTNSIRVLAAAGGTFAVFNAVAGRACLSVTAVSSLANGVTITGAVTTAAPTIAATGPDSNIDLTLNAKNTGVVNIGPASAAAAISGSVGPATLATTTGGATGPGTAAQNQWLKIKINGTINYVPAWQ